MSDNNCFIIFYFLIKGDSGSGIIADGNIVIGVIKGGFDVCGKNPTLVVSVSDHFSWINETIHQVL